MIIDAHQHYWQLDRGDYGWLTPSLGPIYRDFLPEHLEPCLHDSGIGSTVIVQAAATEAESRFLARLAATTPTAAGLVGWVDMGSVDAPQRISRLRADCGDVLKGVRPMIQDIADDEWVTSPALDSAFDALHANAMTFDALVHPRHLTALRRRMERSPGVRVVIDHCGKPDIASGDPGTWARDMRAIARDSGAYCKLSGLLTQLGEGQPVDAVRPYAELVLEAFGPGRVIWGSDWPVLAVRAGYEEWFGLTRGLLSELEEDDSRLVLGLNAARFYGLAVATRDSEPPIGEMECCRID